MKPGELYTPKNDIMNYYSYLKRIEKYGKDDMMGYIIIELIKYLGHDKWSFKNIGSGSVHYGDPITFENVNYITGEQVSKEYVKIGEASDSALYSKFKDNLKDDGELI